MSKNIGQGHALCITLARGVDQSAGPVDYAEPSTRGDARNMNSLAALFIHLHEEVRVSSHGEEVTVPP